MRRDFQSVHFKTWPSTFDRITYIEKAVTLDEKMWSFFKEDSALKFMLPQNQCALKCDIFLKTNSLNKGLKQIIFYICITILLAQLGNIQWQSNCVKSVQIWSFLWSVFSRIQTEYIQPKYGKIQTRKDSVFWNFSCSVMNKVKDRLQISLLILSEFKRIY